MSIGRNHTSSVDMLAYERPSPAKALQILEGYGIDACLARWPFLTDQAFLKIAEVGRAERRAKDGIIVRGSLRKTTPEQEDAAIADVFALGAVSRAADKHGLTYTLVLKLLQERGITDYPKVSGAEKMRLAAETRRARRALAAAGISATTQDQEKDMQAATSAGETVASHRGRVRKVPDDATLRTDWMRVGNVADLAAGYGVTPAGVRPHLIRLGLLVVGASRSRRAAQPEAQADGPVATLPVPLNPVPAPAQEKERVSVPGRPRVLQGVDRLEVEDLVRAVELARTAGLSPDLAVAFVRADRDASALLRAAA